MTSMAACVCAKQICAFSLKAFVNDSKTKKEIKIYISIARMFLCVSSTKRSALKSRFKHYLFLCLWPEILVGRTLLLNHQ